MSSLRLVNNWMEIALDVEIRGKCQIVSVVQWGQTMLGVSSYVRRKQQCLVLPLRHLKPVERLRGTLLTIGWKLLWILKNM